MAARKDNARTINDQKDEIIPTRKSRLWLGYSADGLRDATKLDEVEKQNGFERSKPASNNRGNGAENDHTLPGSFDDLDGVGASVPLELNEGKTQRFKETRDGTPLRGANEDRNQDTARRQEPKKKLSEVAAAGENQANDTQQKYTEPDDYYNLDELAAPSPVDLQERRSQGYLEERSDESPSKEEDAETTKPSLKRQRVSKLATKLYTISYLVLFSILGTLARLGLKAWTFYPGAPVQTGVLWANVGGSLIMGFLSEDRKLFQEEWSAATQGTQHDKEKGRLADRTPSTFQTHNAVKKTIPLYIGLAVGFCGSFTSFSSFIRDAYLALSNALPVPINHPSSTPISQTINVHRNGVYSFMAILAVLITTVGLCLGALQFGAHLALALEPFTPSIPFLFARKVVDRFVVFLAFGCWLGAVLMTIWPADRSGGPVGSNVGWAQETWRGEALFALIFAPPGCLLRFYASTHLNGRIKAFPLGTFAVNIFGAAMLAMFYDLQHAPIGGMICCQVLQGMEDGFCGCLTTVSTWVVELNALRLRHAYFYGISSMAVGLGFMVIIMGSLQWTQGFKDPLCMTRSI